MPDILTGTFRTNQGTATTKKGLLKGMRFHTWEIIPFCTAVQGCPAHSVCPYEKGGRFRCGVMEEYMTSITELIVYNYGKILDEGELYRVGMHLIPMYNILCKLKIALSGGMDVTITSGRGTITVNPLLREFREQIKAIEGIWKSIGLDGLKEVDLPDIPKESKGLVKGNYYENMEREALNEGKIRFRRKK